MVTFSVSGFPNSQFSSVLVRPPVLTFAGSRKGSLPTAVSFPLVHGFHTLGFSFLTGCAPGIDACFRQVLAHQSWAPSSMVACAFENSALIGTHTSLAAYTVVPAGLSPASALHRRTVWMVRRCGLLVLFPVNPAIGRWGKGSILAFRTAVYNLKPVFVVSPTQPPHSPLYQVYPSSLLGIVPGFWVVPYPIYEGGPCDEE